MPHNFKKAQLVPQGFRAGSGKYSVLHIAASLFIAGGVAVIAPEARADVNAPVIITPLPPSTGPSNSGSNSDDAAVAAELAKAAGEARKILADWDAERELNLPRWATLAHNEGAGPPAGCPTARRSVTGVPVTFKDCNLEYFESRKERWVEVLQSWAVLSPAQKNSVAAQMGPIFESLKNEPGISLAARTVAHGYGGGGVTNASNTAGGSGGLTPTSRRALGLPATSSGGASAVVGALTGISGVSDFLGFLGALGLNLDDGSDALNASLLNGSFASGQGIYDKVLAAHTPAEISALADTARASNARFTKLKPESAEDIEAQLQRLRYNTHTQKKTMAETANMAGNSKNRAAVVKAITEKVQALGASSADQSLVSAQLAQYDFYLAALDALGREDLIKNVAYRQGVKAQEEATDTAHHLKRTDTRIKTANAR
jgi:hypothetical protein